MRQDMLNVTTAAVVVAATLVAAMRGTAGAVKSGSGLRRGERGAAAGRQASPRATAEGISALLYDGRDGANKNAAAVGGGGWRRAAADAGDARGSRRAADVPLVMKKIYEAMSEANDQVAEARDDFEEGFDIVRGLEDQSGGVDKLHYVFNPSSVDGSREDIAKVEFYVFAKSRGLRAGPPLFPSGLTTIKLSLFQVLDERRLFNENGTVDTSSGASLLMTRRILATHQDEVDFRGSRALRDAVEQWLAHPETNRGLLLVATDADGAPLEVGSALLVGSGDRSSPGKQPVLVVYTKTKSPAAHAEQAQRRRRADRSVTPSDAEETPGCRMGPAGAASSSRCSQLSGRAGDRPARRRATAAEVRRRRPNKRIAAARAAGSGVGGDVGALRSSSSASASSEEDSTRDGSYGSGDAPPNAEHSMLSQLVSADAADPGAAPQPLWRESACKPQPFVVPFEELNIPVIVPPKLDIKRCSGSCVLPPTYLERQNVTNHARLLTMMRYLNLTNVSTGPCCVPNELSKASVLYSDADGVVTMRNFDSMVVVSCACR